MKNGVFPEDGIFHGHVSETSNLTPPFYVAALMSDSNIRTHTEHIPEV
jgi:hypothetical protein